MLATVRRRCSSAAERDVVDAGARAANHTVNVVAALGTAFTRRSDGGQEVTREISQYECSVPSTGEKIHLLSF